MSNPFNGPVSRLWIRWKSLNLPWRKQRLAGKCSWIHCKAVKDSHVVYLGFDLHGNTFWEFKDTVRSDRWRRIARQPRTVDYADIQISRMSRSTVKRFPFAKKAPFLSS
jgi:NADH dehydrogenase [ubiquinone] 1 alpha subcomplex assembly factor 2